jgi:hypothetical protein
VELSLHEQIVRVAVVDGGARGAPRVIRDPAGETGRGLLVVQSLSVRTGVCGDYRGRMVWADVPWRRESVPGSALIRQYEEGLRESEATLASWFSGRPVWFGRSTLQWWTLAGSELLTAPTAGELADLLRGVPDVPVRRHSAGIPARSAGAAVTRTPDPRSLPSSGRLSEGAAARRRDAQGARSPRAHGRRHPDGQMTAGQGMVRVWGARSAPATAS